MVTLGAVALLAACGDDTGDAGGDGADASVDSPPALFCQEQVSTLAAELYQTPQGCSAVVRLDYQSFEIRGYQLISGPYAGLNETQARATAQSDAGYGENGVMLNPANPEDTYVFFESPGDFGGAAAVSARTGQSVFGGSIIWSGTGDITYPGDWRPAADLAAGCDPSGGVNSTRGYDLILGQALPQPDVDAVIDVIAQTALPAAMWQGGYVFDAVVLLYPRTVGAFDPDEAEWIAIVNGGWLE